MTLDAQAVLREAEADLPNVKAWREVTDATLKAHDARSFEGTGSKWTFLVVGFPVANGKTGHDGTAVDRKRGQVLHLTRELAQKVYKKATEGQA